MGAHRRLRRAVVTGIAVAAVAGATATPAFADPNITPGASAFSAAGTTGTATLKAYLQLSGSLGGLLDVLVSPIVNQAINPLVAALQGSVSSLVTSALGASSSLSAGTPATQSGAAPGTFPNETVPSPCPSSNPVPCYQVASGPSLNLSPLASAGVGGAQGWTAQVPSSIDATAPIYGRARVLSATVSALTGISSLTNPLVSTGAVDAKANCPNDGQPGANKPKTAPSANVQAAGVSLLGGLVKLSVLNGSITNLVINNISYPNGVINLPTLTVGSVSVSQYGTAIALGIPVAASDLLGALNLDGSVVTQLLGYAPTSTVMLRVVAGPTTQVTSTTASANGLGIGVDLSGTLGFNLLGLVTATVNLPSGLGGSNLGNLLDLRLATVTCKSGTATAPANPAVPPALV
jgi:hypothetical protein